MKRLILLFTVLGSLFSAGRADIAPNVVRTNIAGIDVLAYPTGVKDVVTLRGSLPAGKSLSPDTNVALAALTAQLLDKGTTTHDKFAIAQQLESVGAEISFSAGNLMLNVSAKCLKKDVPLVIALIAEQLRTPAFAPEEFEKAKKQFAGAMQRQLEDTDFRAIDSFTRAAYPLGHPNRQPLPAELIAAVNAAKLEDVKAFHAKYYGPAQFTLVAVGDLDIPQLQSEIGRAFTGWTGGQHLVVPVEPAGTDAAREQTDFMGDKTSVSVLIGQRTGLRYRDADNLPLTVGTAILGSGFTGRLMATVRDKEGLTYDAESFVNRNSIADGDFEVYVSFAPEMLEKGITSTKRELNHWYQDGVTSDELERRKSNMVGEFKVGLATTGGMADQLIATVQRDLPLSWLDQYAGKIDALTLATVNSAIKKHLDPEKMVLIKAGTVPGATAGK